MSLFNLLESRERLHGIIKARTPKNPNFGHFSMDEVAVKRSLSSCLKKVNQNLREKGICGDLVFCTFVKHDGNSFRSLKGSNLIFSYIGPHCTIWMKSEGGNQSGASISSIINKRGDFTVWSYEFIKVEKEILFLVRGIQTVF